MSNTEGKKSSSKKNRNSTPAGNDDVDNLTEPMSRFNIGPNAFEDSIQNGYITPNKPKNAPRNMTPGSSDKKFNPKAENPVNQLTESNKQTSKNGKLKEESKRKIEQKEQGDDEDTDDEDNDDDKNDQEEKKADLPEFQFKQVHNGLVSCLEAPSETILISGSHDGYIKMWEYQGESPASEQSKNQKEIRFVKSLIEDYYNPKQIFCMSTTFLSVHDAQQLIVASGSEDGIVRVFDVTTGTILFKTVPHDNNQNNSITGIAISQDMDNYVNNKLIASVSSTSDKICFYNLMNPMRSIVNEVLPINTIRVRGYLGIVAISMSLRNRCVILCYKKVNESYIFDIIDYDFTTSTIITKKESVHISKTEPFTNNYVIPMEDTIFSSITNNKSIKVAGYKIPNHASDGPSDMKLISTAKCLISTANTAIKMYSAINYQLIGGIQGNTRCFTAIAAADNFKYIAACDNSNTLKIYRISTNLL